MTKKDPFKFTIGFDRKDPEHKHVVDILNDTEKKAQLITKAILYYMGESHSPQITELDITSFQPLIEAIAKKEVEKAIDLKQQHNLPQMTSVSLMEAETPLNAGAEVTRAARNTLKAFRKLNEV